MKRLHLIQQFKCLMSAKSLSTSAYEELSTQRLLKLKKGVYNMSIAIAMGILIGGTTLLVWFKSSMQMEIKLLYAITHICLIVALIADYRQRNKKINQILARRQAN